MVTPNWAMARRSQISSYNIPQKPEIKKKMKYQSIRGLILISEVSEMEKSSHGQLCLATLHPPQIELENRKRMQLTIEKLVYGGDGLARLPGDERGPGKTVFVPFSIDGEQVEAELIEQKPGFARARLTANSGTITSIGLRPDCPYFCDAAAASINMSNYSHQLRD